jgi:AcrR family transcriptional regulator
MEFENRKDQIIKTSAILFKEKGYSGVSMRDIAAEMGIKAASLYNHISSKQEILSEIIISLAETFIREMKEIKSSSESSISKMEKIIELHVHISTHNPYKMACLNNDWMHLDNKREYYLKLRLDYEEDFRKILLEGIEKNELQKGNPEVMLFSILSTLRSLYLWIPKKGDIQYESLSKNLSQVLLNGISIGN